MKFSLLNTSFLYDSYFTKFAKRNNWKKYMKFSANFLPILSELSVLSNESCTAENLSQALNIWRGRELLYQWELSWQCKFQYLSRQAIGNLQSVTKYLRLTLVFMWNSAPLKEFNRYFSGLFASINKISILAVGLRTKVSFYEV